MNSSTQETGAHAHQVAEAVPAATPMIDVMIDTETLGTVPGSAILSVGAVMFGPAGLGAEFYAPVLLASCTDAGLVIDPVTVAWWMKQGDEARAAAFRSDAAPLRVVLKDFSDWFLEQRARKPWCHGATFDVPVMEAAYRACGMAPPWDFWNVRDTRTLYDLAGLKVDRSEGTHHNALDDAIAQAKAAAQAMRVLRARGDASTMTPELLTEIALAFCEEAEADAEIRAGGPGRLLAFDYFKRGWLGNGGAVNARLAGEGAAA